MAEFSIDRFVDLYAHRTSGMSASEVRALFAVASRPEVVSLAGGHAVRAGAAARRRPRGRPPGARRARRRRALQYGGGQGHPALRERLLPLMAEEGRRGRPRGRGGHHRARSRRSTSSGKIFIDPGDLIAVEAPAYVGALTAFSAYEPRYLQIDLDDDGMIVEQLEEALVRGERPKFVYTVPELRQPRGCDDVIPTARAAGLAVPRGRRSRSSRTTRTACCGSRASRSPACEPSTPRT